MVASAGEVLAIVIIAILAGVGLGALFLSRFVKIVQQGSVGVVKRLGEFKSVDQPGMRILIPFIDKMEKVDVREFPMTGDQQAVITKDNVSLQVSATIFCQVIDVKSALFEINDFQLAVDQLSRTALRAVFGELSLDQALEFLRADECVEVTPHSVRLRKVSLDKTARVREARAVRAAAGSTA